MALGIVDQAYVSASVHELRRRSNFQCCVVNPSGIFHFCCRIKDLWRKKNDDDIKFLGLDILFSRKRRPISICVNFPIFTKPSNVPLGQEFGNWLRRPNSFPPPFRIGKKPLPGAVKLGRFTQHYLYTSYTSEYQNANAPCAKRKQSTYVRGHCGGKRNPWIFGALQ